MNDDFPPADSARGLLKSMMVIASAQFLSIIIRILKTKLVAVMLGPSGIGILSILVNLQMLGSQLAGLGLPQSGVRELAAARGDVEVVARLRQVLVAALALQGGIALTVIWLLRERLSVWLLGEAGHATAVGLVGVAVLLFLLASSQRTLLQGMRRMGDLGRAMVLGTLVGAVAGITAVWLMGRDGLIWFLLVEPLGALVVTVIYVRRLPLPARSWVRIEEVWRRWQPMAHLGIALMLGGFMTTATLLMVRTLITRDLGFDAAGHFAAAYTITVVYGGFMLNAMQMDYFPRLSEVMRDYAAAARLINTQTQLTVAISGPVILFMIGLAPWVIQLLYAASFSDAAILIQWQMVGSLFKVTAWSIGQGLPASGRSGLYLIRQIPLNLVLFSIIWFGLPAFGLEITGIAFLCAYLVHLVVVVIFARRIHGFRWHRRSLRLLFLHTALCTALLVAARTSPEFAAIAAIVLAALTAIIGLRAVIAQIGTQGRLVSHILRFYERIGWPVKETR